MAKKTIKYCGSLIGLKSMWRERYIILHRHTFPGVLDRISKSNIHNYSIFLYQGKLFSNFAYHGKDYAADMKAISDETTRDWWKLTDPMQKPIAGRKKGEWWAEMEQVFLQEDLVISPKNISRTAFCLKLNSGNITIQKIVENIKTHKNSELFNIHIYVWQNSVYFYFETLMGEKFHPQNLLLPKEMRDRVKPMELVFHTD